MKKFLSIFAAAALGTPAVAGPYVNVESNTGFYGNDYKGSLLESHVGYEGVLGESTGWYIQTGPGLIFDEGEDADVELSGKAGLVTEVSENVELYGEYSFITGDELASGVKVGATYRF